MPWTLVTKQLIYEPICQAIAIGSCFSISVLCLADTNLTVDSIIAMVNLFLAHNIMLLFHNFV